MTLHYVYSCAFSILVNLSQFVTYMEFDFDNKKQAMVNSTYDPSSGKSTVNSRIVLDFGKVCLVFVFGGGFLFVCLFFCCFLCLVNTDFTDLIQG